MKITKARLKKIILEELEEIRINSLNEAPVAQPEIGKAKATVSQVRSGAMDAASSQGEQGITSQERGLIKQLSDMLVGASKETNILSGAIVTRIKQLAAELQKAQKTQPQQGVQK